MKTAEIESNKEKYSSDEECVEHKRHKKKSKNRVSFLKYISY